jgi:hypothetical protein
VNGRSRSGHSAGARALAVLTVAMLLVAERRRRHGPRNGGGGGAGGGAAEEHFPAAADLAADRRFERSLVFRQAGIVLAIAALILFRGLLS